MSENNFTPPKELASKVSDAYEKKPSLPLARLLRMGIMAGIYIGFGAFASSLASHAIDNFSVARIISGAIFPIGLMMVIITGAELFTGNTMLSIPLSRGRIRFLDYFKNLSLVWLMNFVGSILLVLLLFAGNLYQSNQGAFQESVINTALSKAHMPILPALMSGILCNIMVCGAIYMSYSTDNMAAKVLIIWFIIMAFVVSGFQHSVANMYYLSAGLILGAKGLSLTSILIHLVAVTIGNLLGGSFFIGLVYKKAMIGKE